MAMTLPRVMQLSVECMSAKLLLTTAMLIIHSLVPERLEVNLCISSLWQLMLTCISTGISLDIAVYLLCITC